MSNNKEIDIGGRPPKALTNTDIIQVEALSAVCTKSQMASYFGMTEKPSGLWRNANQRFLPPTGGVVRRL